MLMMLKFALIWFLFGFRIANAT